MIKIDVKAFEVNKQNLNESRILAIPYGQNLAKNEVILKVDKFALTANNISYAIAGDTLGYWRFFPTENVAEQEQWGRMPVMGFADVIASNCPEIQNGERVWGFFPMASHLKINAGNISSTGFSDISAHREGLSPIYAAFERVKANPFYQKSNEDIEMLVRGLFTTSWLVNDYMFDNQFFGASQYLITSASSKTSIALAFAIKEQGKMTAIGITSEKNRKFVESLNCYQQVISYDEIEKLDAKSPSILVDMAGSQTALSKIHHHFLNQLKYSCRIGVTHHNDLVPNELSSKYELPGATPTFFFAPTQLKKRTKDWGVNETMKQIGISLQGYIEFCLGIITINHTHGAENVDEIYQQVLQGSADASIGQIVTIDD